MPYSYNDFLNAATSSGLLGEFSQADLETAQRYPEFGLSILSLKRDYHDAATDEQKLLANEAATNCAAVTGTIGAGQTGAVTTPRGRSPARSTPSWTRSTTSAPSPLTRRRRSMTTSTPSSSRRSWTPS